MYKLNVSNYFFTEGNRMDKESLIDIAISTNSLLLYSFNLSHKKNIVNRYRVRDFKELNISKIKEKSIVIHDFSKFEDLEQFKDFIENCEKNNKILILPFLNIPYNRKNVTNSLYDIYRYINTLKLKDISDRGIFRSFKLGMLLP